jgi:hypothetical protein
VQKGGGFYLLPLKQSGCAPQTQYRPPRPRRIAHALETGNEFLTQSELFWEREFTSLLIPQVYNLRSGERKQSLFG